MTVLLITARLGSTRLAQKHLLPVGEKPILQYLVDAMNQEFKTEVREGLIRIVIATSTMPENQAFATRISGCEVFYGSNENIPLRHLQAASHFKADRVLSVDGDDILCDGTAVRAVFQALSAGARLSCTKGLPLGMNASGYRSDYLSKRVRLLGEAVCETGWGRIFDPADYEVISLPPHQNESLRFTLDYQQDFVFFKALLSRPEIVDRTWGSDQIVRWVLEQRLDEITRPIAEEYWRNFNEQKAKEEVRK